MNHVLGELREPRGDFARLLRAPGYRGFVLTVSLARVSGAMFNVSGVLLVLDRTGSVSIAGLTAAATVLPGAIAGPLLGAWLDVVRRRRALIVIDQLVSVVGLVLMLVVAGHGPDWTLPLIGVLYSITRPFSTGGFYAAMLEITGTELLDPASKIEATSLNLAVLLGPALAGFLVGVVGAAATVGAQAALALIAAGLIALNPAFGAQPKERTPSVREAVRTGTRVLLHTVELRSAVIGTTLSSAGWGLMIVGFPLYCTQILSAHAHDGGYLWAALGVGSILGTFAIRRRASLPLSAASYAALAVSALLWPVAHVLILAVLLVALTGFLEGPAFSGSVVLRQRQVPSAVRGQVTTTVVGLIGIAVTAATAAGGAIADPTALIDIFVALNLAAAGVVLLGARTARRPAATS
ncbi:MAG TPA: MFS transporter [Solirubrobacteraceae bacterium]